ncbi:MAG: hypothetical protein OXT72_02405, partial [Gammaproteobacteria bacterium]|nr:hypothetical protein [Gammaproteobacteria bacterium]MDE0248957.1 hypothetical protein [Gammaproteobacteria bacterium]
NLGTWTVLFYIPPAESGVNSTDDFCVLGKAPAAEMLAAVNRLIEGLKLPINAEKIRCLRSPRNHSSFSGIASAGTIAPGVRAGMSAHVRVDRVFRASAAGSASKRTAVLDGWKPRRS